MSDKILGLLGLMRRAGAIEIGETYTGEAAHAHKAKLILVASDASENAQKRAETFAYAGHAPQITVPYTKEEIAGAVGLTGGSMAAITDSGFAAALLKQLKEQNPDQFAELADRFVQKLQSAPNGKKLNTVPNKRRK